jgi:Flp pilus assembly protein TadG
LRRLARRCRDTRGQSLVEAAIVLPLLLLLTFATFDFAAVFYVYLALENGVSQATRYAVTGQQMNDPNNPGNQLSPAQSIEAAMRLATPTLTLPDGDFTFTHMTPGSNTWTAGTGGPSDIDKVAVSYTWNIMTPLVRPFFPGGQITLRVESAMKNEPRFN